MKITKEKRIAFLQWMFGNNLHWAVEAMLRIHDNQELDEKEGAVRYSNGVGFNSYDAEKMCHLANIYKANLMREEPKPAETFFRDWEIARILSTMPKYARQILETKISDVPKQVGEDSDLQKLDKKIELYGQQIGVLK